MRKNTLTDYGVAIKKRLIDLEQTQEWLISEIKKRSDMFVDSSLINRVMTGRIKNSSLRPVIDEILGLGLD